MREASLIMLNLIAAGSCIAFSKRVATGKSRVVRAIFDDGRFQNFFKGID
jgi:hypothetical protein